MPARKLLLVASKTGYQTREFARRAVAAGYELRMATDRCHVLEDPWGDGAIPLRFEEPETEASTLDGLAVDGVVAVGDRPAYVAACIAERLKVPFHSPRAVAAASDKFAARRAFEDAGLPVPAFERLPLSSDPAAIARTVRYPVVLKPLSLSASRGVIRADSPEEFKAAFGRIAAILAAPDLAAHRDDCLLVEEFIPGREFAVEGLMTDGRLDILAIFDKPDPLDGPFFEETIYVTPSREPPVVQAEIRLAVKRAVEALGLTHGPVHAEMRVNSRGVWMLEVAARPIGGLCAAALRFEGGFGLEDLILHHAAGAGRIPSRLSDPARGVMMIPIPRPGIYAGVGGSEEARTTPGIEDVAITAKEGQRLIPLPEGASYLGFLFARGDSPAAVEASLRRAHGQLRFDITTALTVV